MVLDELRLDEPKTKEMTKILAALGIAASALIAIGEPEQNVVKSARNLPGIKTIPTRLLNVVDIISHKMLLITETSLRQIEQMWGKGAS